MKWHETERRSEVVKHSSYQQRHTVLGQRAWAIKLGSGGSSIDFCEKHQIIGIGWVGVSSTGQIFRFVEECAIGDYVIYYDPRRKRVRICRVLSEALYRDFDLSEPEVNVDIWHYRRVEYPVPPIPIADFFGGLKGRLLDARMFFWELPGAYQTIEQIARSRIPRITAGDLDMIQAYATLRDLLVTRAEALSEQDWQCVVVDYLRAQGATVDEQKLSDNHTRSDIDARFDHGEFGSELWRVRVRRYEGQKMDWLEIQEDLSFSGDNRFCFVSVFGFTEQARQLAARRGVRLMQAADFALFFLTGRVRENIRQKLGLPVASTSY